MALQIGDFVTFRSWESFYSLAKTYHSKNYLIHSIDRAIEPDRLIALYVERKNNLKWQVTGVCTEENHYNLESENIFLTSAFYDTQMLINAQETEFHNLLFDKQTEYRISSDVCEE